MFEQLFSKLKRDAEIFEQYKKLENTGIKISNEKKRDFFKTGKELLPIKKSEEFMKVRSIHYNYVVTKKLEDYSLPEWFICLEEKVLLEYAIPVFSRVLQKYPMLCGINNEWQVLYEIAKIDSAFWQENREWKDCFEKIIDDILDKYEQELLRLSYAEEYLYRFQAFKNI